VLFRFCFFDRLNFFLPKRSAALREDLTGLFLSLQDGRRVTASYSERHVDIRLNVLEINFFGGTFTEAVFWGSSFRVRPQRRKDGPGPRELLRGEVVRQEAFFDLE